ncbi:MAG: DNA primase [Succinivibrionaceae bacterium]
MAGKIPQEFITELLSRTDIVEVMREHQIVLKSAGRGEYKACCPFHNERTPSFYVSQDKQLYNCFGCHCSGNVITFIKEYDRLDFTDAVHSLAERLGLTVPDDNNSSSSGQFQGNYSTYFTKMQDCADLYHRNLLESRDGSVALNYLENRGINLSTVQQFKLGYAPDEWNFLTRSLSPDPQELQMLSDLGMIKPRPTGGYFDMFRNRIIIPILDRRGRTIAFGGRVMDDQQPKYLNSPETSIFHKSRELFGLYQAIEFFRDQHISPIPQLMIVEGYMDVIALAQNGIHFAVASLGTSTTQDQLTLIFRNTKKLICCYDGDAAGHKAAWRALQLILPIISDDCDVTFAFLPSEHDPDSYVRAYGQEGFVDYLKKAMNLNQYFFSYLVTHQLNEGSNVELANNALTILATMPDNLRLHTLLSELSARVYIDEDKLESKLSSMRRNVRNLQLHLYEEPETFDELTPLRRVIVLTVQYPKSIKQNIGLIADLLTRLIQSDINLKGLDVLAQLIDYINNKPQENLSSASLLSAFEGTALEKWLNLAANYQIYVQGFSASLEDVANDITSTLSRILLEHQHNIVAALQKKSMTTKLSEQEMQELTKTLKFIKEFRGKTIDQTSLGS